MISETLIKKTEEFIVVTMDEFIRTKAISPEYISAVAGLIDALNRIEVIAKGSSLQQ